MPFTLPVQIYERLENKLGKEDAHIIFEALETSIKNTIEEKSEKLKYTVIEEVKKDLASKQDVELVKKEIDIVRKEIDMVRKEIDMVRKEMRMQFIILIMIIVLLNQNSLELLGKILGVIK